MSYKLSYPSEEQAQGALESAGDCDPDVIVNEDGEVVGLVFFEKDEVKAQLEAGASR